MHIEVERLEDYSLNRLSEVDTAKLEEHMLVCTQCQAALAELDAVIAALPIAAFLSALLAKPVLQACANCVIC